MDESLLVNRAVTGDLDAFGQLYDAYFNRVYDFAWRILRDADDAADATQDVFMKAVQALPSLTKAASFKSWIFTVAHNVAVTRAEGRSRTVPLPATHEEAFGGFDVPDASRLDDAALVAEDHELATLVWEAAAGLNPRDYALLDLHVRQGLDGAEIAGVLGVNKGNAYTMVSRMKTAATDVIQSYVVARRGNKDCEGLQRVLAAHSFPPYSDDVRNAVDAHIKECEVCSQAKGRLAAPLAILGGFAMVPAPFALKGDVWRNVAERWPAAGSAEATAMPVPHDDRPYAAAPAGGGFGGMTLGAGPGASDDGDSLRNRLLLFAAAVIGLLIFAFAGGAIIAGGFGGDDDDGGARPVASASGTPPGTAVAGGTSTPGVAVETATPDLTPDPTEAATGTATPGSTTPTEEPATDTPVAASPTPARPTATDTPRGGPPPATPTPTLAAPDL